MQIRNLETKEFNKEMLQEEYYYLEGTCPEIMSLYRLRNYASNMVQANKDEEHLPEKYKRAYARNPGQHVSDEDIVELITWFGEQVYSLKA